ncbi:hypothetical protein NKG94_05190 [Micromonospora sp. M12]
MQAAAVERLIDRDPAAAKAGVAWIRTQGKETLDNLRLVVGVLRGRPGDEAAPRSRGWACSTTSSAPRAPSPARWTSSGRGPARGAADRRRRALSDRAGVPQQHPSARPGAPARVVLRFEPRSVSLEVVNEPADRRQVPAARTGGVGLVGMRERAQLIGATFTAGPTPAGGWSVTTTLPTHGPAASHPREEASA